MNAADYPRTVVISATPFAADTPNGHLLQSLFCGWPKERLAQIYFPVARTSVPDYTLCGDYRCVSLMGKISRVKPSKNLPAVGRPSIAASAVSLIEHRIPLSQKLRPLVEAVRIVQPLARKLARELTDLRPDRVYALLGNSWMSNIVPKACAEARVPFYAHVTDDFVTSLYRGTFFGSAISRFSERAFRRVVDDSNGRAAISPLMADEYQSRYGKAWDWFTTAVDPDAYDLSPRSPDGEIRFVYAGGLGIGRWRTIREVAAALSRVGDRLGIRPRLDLYAPQNQVRQHRAALEATGVIRIQGWVGFEQLPEIFHNADVLLHVESFDDAIAAYTRHSFSTKLSQYMMAARCILAAGPEQSGSSRMVDKAQAGVLAGSQNPATLDKAIAPIFVDASLRRTYAENGRSYATRWFTASSNRERFRAAIVNAQHAETVSTTRAA